MTAEGRRKRAAETETTDGVFGGTIAKNGQTCRAALKTTEEIDPQTGTVTEVNRSIAAPTLSTKDEISDKRYCRIRAYLLRRRRQLLNAERYRNTVFPPNWKPVRRMPKQVASSVLCPDCDGSGYAKKGDCPRCKGDGWVRSLN